MGYSKWASVEETLKTVDAVNLDTGVKHAGVPIGYDNKYLYVNSKPGHTLIIGSTGSGKTQATILPSLKLALMAGESVLLNDPKGEIYEKTANAFKENGYNVIVLDYDDPKLGNAWNPIKLAYDLYKKGDPDKAIKVLEYISYYLFYEGTHNEDLFWTISATDYFIGLALYLFENADDKQISIKSICDFSNYVMDNIDDFVTKLAKDSLAYVNLIGTLKAPSETRGGIVSVFNQNMRKYTSKINLTEMLSYSDFDIMKVPSEKTAIFIVSGPTSYCNNLIPLFVNEIIETYDMNDNNNFLNVLLDEFDGMVPIKDFSVLISYCRSLNIRMMVTVRSFAHLNNMYTKMDAEILRMCFNNVIYLLSEDIYTLEEISKYCGNTDEGSLIKPLITPEELKTLKIFEAVVLMQRNFPLKSKLLPDYEINWGIEFTDSKIPIREKK